MSPKNTRESNVTTVFFSFISAEFADESSSPKKGPPLQLVLKSEGSTNYGNEYSATLPLTPDSTREILSVINRS